jgi:hypothetical protein
MWTCANCGELNAEASAACEVCDRPRETSTPPPRRVRVAPPPPPIEPDPIEPGPIEPGPIEPGPADMPPGRHRTWAIVLAAVLVAGLIVGAVFVVPRLLHSDRTPVASGTPTAGVPSAEPTSAEPTSADPTPTDEPSPSPTETTGLVSVDPGVTDGRASDVAAMFDTYFTGVNEKDYDAVGTVLDPAGSIDPGNAGEMAGLARGTKTTQDSDITLTAMSDSGGDRLLAQLTFQSEQAAGDGPKGRSSETCTRWSIGYTVSGATTGSYRIVKSKASSRPC